MRQKPCDSHLNLFWFGAWEENNCSRPLPPGPPCTSPQRACGRQDDREAAPLLQPAASPRGLNLVLTGSSQFQTADLLSCFDVFFPARNKKTQWNCLFPRITQSCKRTIISNGTMLASCFAVVVTASECFSSHWAAVHCKILADSVSSFLPESCRRYAGSQSRFQDGLEAISTYGGSQGD